MQRNIFKVQPWLFSMALLLVLGRISAVQAQPDSARRPKRMVLMWVAPYATTQCLTMLNKISAPTDGNVGITHLALQFWAPDGQGELFRSPDHDVELSDELIGRFRAWGREHHVKVLLCLYNGYDKNHPWDWRLARAVFAHSAQFVQHLTAEVRRLQLDGIDVDLEGTDPHSPSQLDPKVDRDRYVEFVRLLAQRLHSDGKILTLDSFPWKWNAPNQMWWPSLWPYIEGLTAMGYNDTGKRAKDWAAYQALQDAAGEHADKLLLGMQTDTANWQGDDLRSQLNWVLANRCGVALWNAQLTDPQWQSPQTWQLLQNIQR
jgi:hypothetical protein